MKYLALMFVLLCAGCHEKMDDERMATMDHDRQMRTAQFINTHNCAIRQSYPARNGWDDDEAKPIHKRGFDSWRCDDINDDIDIHDDEVQPNKPRVLINQKADHANCSNIVSVNGKVTVSGCDSDAPCGNTGSVSASGKNSVANSGCGNNIVIEDEP